MHSKSRFSKELQKMQVIRPNHLHCQKENFKESLRNYQEEGRGKIVAKIGDHTECPDCRRTSRIVWISPDGKTVGIQCPASHSLTDQTDLKFNSVTHSSKKTSRNMVFMTEIKARAKKRALQQNEN